MLSTKCHGVLNERVVVEVGALQQLLTGDTMG